MDDPDPEDGAPLEAGEFSVWLREMQGALRGERASEVPCGGCTACCTSSQFVHIEPDETETLARIPPALLFPAPRLPAGHRLLGYDERGHCPMLVEGRCSIYEHRPRTCRTYDCRIFAAAGVEAGADDLVSIGRRARRWRFDVGSTTSVAEQEAVRAAATFLANHPCVPDHVRPASAARLAVLAIQVHAAFLGQDQATGLPVVVEPHPEDVLATLRRSEPNDPLSAAGATSRPRTAGGPRTRRHSLLD